MAARRLPRSRAALARAVRGGARPLAHPPVHHRRSPPSRRSRPCGRATPSRTCGCSSSAARRARPSSQHGSPRTAARCGTPTGRPRRPSSPARRRWTGRCRCGSDCRWTDGRSRSSTPQGEPVAEGGIGELIIGGVGLARYLDPAKDLEKYAPMPTLGWDRAYRSGDLVRFESEGLVFQGRADDQVKVGGRRIELGEVETALQDLEGVSAAAAAVRTTEAGVPVLVGYLVVDGRTRSRGGARRARRGAARGDRAAARGRRRASGPHLGQGRPRRAALAAPRRRGPGGGPQSRRSLARRAVAGRARARRARPQDGLLRPGRRVARRGAARLAHPRTGPGVLGRRHLRRPPPRRDGQGARPAPRRGRRRRASGRPEPTPRVDAVGADGHQRTAVHPLRHPVAALPPDGGDDPATCSPPSARCRTAPWWVLVVGLLVFATPFGRMAVAAASARVLLAGLQPGDYPRGRDGAPAALARRADRPAGRCGGTRRRALGVVLRACARGEDRPRRRHARRFRPSPGCSRSATAPRSSPRWISPATGSTATRCGSVRSAWEPTRRWAPAARWPPARASASAPRSLPGSAVFGRVRADQAWAGSPAERVGAAASRLAGRAPAPPQPLAVGVRLIGRGARAPPDRVVRRRGARDRARHAGLRDPRCRARGGVPLARPGDPGGRRRVRRRRGDPGPAALARTPRGHLPRPQSLRLAGVDDRAAARLRPDDPLPAVLEPVHPGLAPDAGRRGRQGRRGVDRPADPVDDPHRGWRVPRRRHDGRVLRAHRRLDARRRRADRQASLPRQLRDGGRRVTASRATGSSPSSRPPR